MINGITGYRILIAPVLLVLILKDQYDLFKWLLAFSFFTDAIDGYLARRYNSVSIIGARLDSIGDDLTVGMAITGLLKWNFSFVMNELLWVCILVSLFILQVTCALIRYRKMTAFHTYLAKTAAVTQAIFLLACFFYAEPSRALFYVTALITALGLTEEIILICLLKDYRFDVKGLYWVLKKHAPERTT